MNQSTLCPVHEARVQRLLRIGELNDRLRDFWKILANAEGGIVDIEAETLLFFQRLLDEKAALVQEPGDDPNRFGMSEEMLETPPERGVHRSRQFLLTAPLSDDQAASFVG